MAAAASTKEPGARRARAARKKASRPGRRLFKFDREIGTHLVAGADEAGRGCLAGPLLAAAVLFDVEALTPAQIKALGDLDDSKQHTPEARERMYPLILETAKRVCVVTRSARSIDRRGLHKTNLSALADALRRVSCDCDADVTRLVDGFSLPGLETAAQGGDRRRWAQRRDRSGFDRGEGDQGPVHASRRRAASRVELRPARRLFDARAQGRDPEAGTEPAAPDVVSVGGLCAAGVDLGGAHHAPST